MLVPSIVLRKFGKPSVRLPFEQRHVQVAAEIPFAIYDVFRQTAASMRADFPSRNALTT